MDIKTLMSIVEIAKLRSISKAADKLFLTQPTMSKILKRAEDELGCQIFYRKHETFAPTDAGEIVLSYAHKILDSYNQLERTLSDLKGLRTGHVTLGLPATVSLLFFIPIISEFRRNYPSIDFRWMEGGGTELAERVVSGNLDMSIAASPANIAELNEIWLYRDEIALGMRDDHPLAKKDRIAYEDLQGIPVRTYLPGFSVHKLFLDRMCQAGVTPLLDCCSGQSDIIVELTIWGNGVCALPRPALQYYHYPNLAIRSFYPVLPWELCLLYRKNTYVTDAARCLQATIQSHFARYNAELMPAHITERV